MAMKTAALALAINYGVHVGSSWAYSKVCMPQSVWDLLLQSVVTTASPVCSFVLNTMQATQTNYATLITTTVVAAVSRMLGT
jgi:hypothetical protein